MFRADISDILKDWPYDPARNVRRIIGPDGVERLQVRVPLGIEQYELEGRPDGLRPESHESWLELLAARFEQLPESERRLTPEDCARLHDEGVLYYFRYLICFQIRDYDRVVRDTGRNLRMFDFIRRYAVREEDKARGDQYRPYLLRMLAAGRAMKLGADGRFQEARRVLEDAIRQIEQLEVVCTPTFEFEKHRAIPILRSMAQEMLRRQAPSEKELLRRRLKEAIKAEDYERAAKLRDLLRSMRNLSGDKPQAGRNDQGECPGQP